MPHFCAAGRRRDIRKKLSPEQLALYREIDTILWQEWDPIGISCRGPRDEYRGYVPQVFQLVLQGAEPSKIAEHLSQVAVRQMGIHSSPGDYMPVAKRIQKCATMNKRTEASQEIEDEVPSEFQTEQTPAASPWERLKSFTPARVALGRAGAGLPTQAHLAFQLDHARARDAVYSRSDTDRLCRELTELELQVVTLHSAAHSRAVYLQRPDLGRRLDADSRAALTALPPDWDVVFVLADGLSATALNSHALPLLQAVLPDLRHAGWRLGPVSLVAQGRVAIGDEIGALLEARLVVVLLGERPGLSAPDSLGVYLTWQPQPGRTDAERNCLSNIRSGGLSYELAAARLLYLLTEARRRQLSGVALKEAAPVLATTANPGLSS